MNFDGSIINTTGPSLPQSSRLIGIPVWSGRRALNGMAPYKALSNFFNHGNPDVEKILQDRSVNVLRGVAQLG